MGLPHTAHRLPHAQRLYQRRGRGGGGGGSAASLPLRVLPAGVPRDRRRPRLLLAQTVRLPQHTETTELLGGHQPRHRQHR